MKKLIAPLLVIVVIVLACNKDKFTTEPQLKAKSISPKESVQGDLISFKGSFTDEEGDIDSAFIVYKKYNSANTATDIDTFRDYTITALQLPAGTRSGDFTITFSNGRQIDPYPQLPNTPPNRDTLITLGLIVKDKAGNRSNYAESEKITLKRP